MVAGATIGSPAANAGNDGRVVITYDPVTDGCTSPAAATAVAVVPDFAG